MWGGLEDLNAFGITHLGEIPEITLRSSRWIMSRLDSTGRSVFVADD